MAIPFGRTIRFLEGDICHSCRTPLAKGHGYHHDHVLDYFMDYIHTLDLSSRDTQLVIGSFAKAARRYMRFRTCPVCDNCNAKDGHLKSPECLDGKPAVLTRYMSCKPNELCKLALPKALSLEERIAYGKKITRKYEAGLQRRMKFGRARIDRIVARL